MKYPLTVAAILTGALAGCKKSTPPKEVQMAETESEEAHVEGAWRYNDNLFPWPKPHYEKIESSTIGLTLDDAVRVLGKWDMVGDVLSDKYGQLYPFSGRSGYNYVVRIGKGDQITGVWRRKLN